MKNKLARLAPLVAALALAATTPAATRAAAPVEVPFSLEHDEVIVSVTVDGHGPLTMMLDTGSNPSAVDLATARRIGLKLSAEGESVSGGGEGDARAFATSLGDVKVGGVTAHDLEAAAIDLSTISEHFGHQIDGVLGYNFLAGRVVQIDYPKKVVRFLDASPETKAAIPFEVVDGSPIVRDVEVNGAKVTALVDTGSSGFFSLTAKATARLGLEDAARAGQASAGAGYNGGFTSTAGRVASLRVGDVTVKDAETKFWPAESGHDEDPFDADIGNRFLEPFVVTFDYRRDVMTLGRP